MAAIASANRWAVARSAVTARSAMLWVSLILIVLLICVPIAMIILGAFNVAAPGQAFRFGVDNWQKAWSDPEIRAAVWNTIAILVVRMAIGLPIAIMLAWLIARTNLPGARWFEFGLWLTFFLPTLASLQGWIFLMEGRVGLINQWIAQVPFAGTSPLDIYSFWGIVWVHLMSHTISSLFILLVGVFRNMDGGLEDAARVCGTSELAILRRVTLPLMRPALAVAVVLAIIRGLQSFEIERVLGAPAGVSVYATLVVNLLRDQPPRLAQATALSTAVLFILVPLIALQRLSIGERNYTTITGRARPALVNLGRLRWPAFAAVALFEILATVMPLAALLLGSVMRRWGYFGIPEPWTLKHWQTVLTDSTFVSALTSSLLLGVLSGVFGTLVIFGIAYVLARTAFQGRDVLDFVSWLPWAIPGVLLSLGMLTMVLTIPPLRILHGTFLVLTVAIVLYRFPLGVQLLKSGMMQVGRELEEASQVAGARWWYTQVRINLPILAPMLVTVGLVTFVTAMTEVSGVVLLAGAGTRTLSLLALDLLSSQHAQKEAASVVTTLVVLISAAVTLAARRVGGLRV